MGARWISFGNEGLEKRSRLEKKFDESQAKIQQQRLRLSMDRQSTFNSIFISILMFEYKYMFS